MEKTDTPEAAVVSGASPSPALGSTQMDPAAHCVSHYSEQGQRSGQDQPVSLRVGVLGYLSLRVGAGSHTQHQAGSRGKEAGAEGRAGHETGEISLKKAVHPLLTLYIPHLELLLLNVGILTSILEGNRLKEVKPTNVKNACGLWS